MLGAFGDRDLLLAREITKKHETLAVRPISGHLENLSEERGEFTLVLRGAPRVEAEPTRSPEATSLTVEFCEMTNNDAMTRRQALRKLAERHNISAREVFALLEAAKRSGE
jgi:16S rRNA C1402 (ribose-2'-O) methylase RsmI